MNRKLLNRDGEEVLKILSEPKVQGTKLYVLAVVVWHILCWIERQDRK